MGWDDVDTEVMKQISNALDRQAQAIAAQATAVERLCVKLEPLATLALKAARRDLGEDAPLDLDHPMAVVLVKALEEIRTMAMAGAADRAKLDRIFTAADVALIKATE